MNDLITIVVPIYQVEKYLRECIESILKQTYKNIEIILVDDGSKDKSGEICDEYKRRDSRIRVIHKHNGGLSDARNSGINIANGKYICFIDSDDKISEIFVERLYRLIKENDLDIAACNFQTIMNDDEIKKEYSEEFEIYTAQEALKKSYIFQKGIPFIVAWNKLYKLSLFDDIRYPKGKINEDEFTTYKLIYKSKKIIYTPDELYYYYQRDNDSIMRQKYNKKRLDVLDAYEERLEFYSQKKEKELYDLTFENYCYMLKQHYACCKIYLKEKEISNQLLKKIRENRKKFIKMKTISIKSKITYTITSIFPIILEFKFKNMKKEVK